MKSIFDMLKIISIEDGYILTAGYQRFTMWEIEGIDCYFRSPSMSGAYMSMIKELREHTFIHFFQISEVKKRKFDTEEIIIKQRLNYLNKLGLKEIHSYVAICDELPKNSVTDRQLNLNYHKSILASMLGKCRRLGTDEIRGILYRFLSSDDNIQVHPKMTEREKLLQSQYSSSAEYFKIGNMYNKILSLKFLPDQTNSFMLSYLLDYVLYDYIYTVSLEVGPQAKEYAALGAKERFYVATNGRGASRNAQETDELLTMLAETKEKISYLSSKIILFDRSIKQLEITAEEITGIMKGAFCYYEQETWMHDMEFFRSLPGTMQLSTRQHRILATNFIDMLPVARHGHGNDSAISLFLRNRFGELYGFDAGSSKRNNKNGSIFGASGSGKSVTVNAMIAHTFFPNIRIDKKHPGRIFIVDFAGAENSSYLKMADLYGGVFIPIDSKGRIVINPFPERRFVYKDGKWDSSVLNFLNITIDLILSVKEKTMEAELFRAIISNAVREMYLRIEKPVLSDLMNFIVDDDSKKVAVLKKLLKAFLDDPVSRIINGHSTVNYGSDPFVIYDLQGVTGMNDKLKELITFIVIQEAKKTAFEITNSFILFDEAAQLIKDPRLGDLIEELFATARKYNTGVWTITQNFLSFKESNLSSKIKINTTTTIFLSHANDEEAKRLVAQDFGFTDQERGAFDSLQTVKGEYALALFRTQMGDTVESEVVRIELSPFDYAVATSDKEDNRLFKEYAGRRKIPLIEALAEISAHSLRTNMFVVDSVRMLLK